MLGWEYPPNISGGLGTACEGLTKGLARQGVELLFVVPHLYGGEAAPHMRIVGLVEILLRQRRRNRRRSEQLLSDEELRILQRSPNIKEVQVPAFLQPYWDEEKYAQYRKKLVAFDEEYDEIDPKIEREINELKSSSSRYGKNIFNEVDRFSRHVIQLVRSEEFDIIHAHDWMTFKAGVAIAELTGKPLVSHIHSLEYDRSGHHVNQKIHELERFGVRESDAVIAVSQYTRTVINREHGIPLDKISVVHNGIYPKDVVRHYKKKSPGSEKIVLFLGRITYQKGPNYFIEAAAKVIPHVPNVKFVVAGTGDMLPFLMERVSQLGIKDHFIFTGFLREKEVEQIFSLADLYVLPSVSEPFGISVLESLNFNTPAIISKQSGVSEVIGNTLKFDFWDVSRLADLMINALLYDELRYEMMTMAKEELKRVRWDAAAMKTVAVYKKLLGTKHHSFSAPEIECDSRLLRLPNKVAQLGKA